MPFLFVFPLFLFVTFCTSRDYNESRTSEVIKPTFIAERGAFSLLRGQSVKTQANLFHFQNDGNVVLYERATNRPRWSTNTNGTNANQLQFQTDGNLVLYGSNGPLWNSATAGRGQRFVIQSDQNIVIYDASNVPVWSSGTAQNTASPVTSPIAVSASVKTFSESWNGRALQLQSALDNEAPLGRATFLGTHNSYNSRAYAGALRYLDPNQLISIYEQLKIGARAIELDVHSIGGKLLLCHARANHLGCTGRERVFREALDEIQTWINETASKPEVLMVYLEDFIDAAMYDQAIAEISQTIGQHVFRPTAHCDGIPMETTKRQILESGKRVLLITDGCKNTNFQTWVFGGMGENRLGIPTDEQKTYERYPACKSQVFDAVSFDKLLVRFFEDRTFLASTFGRAGMKIDAEISKGLLRCGANLMGWDMLTAEDGRMQQGIWSWDQNEPTLQNGCAQMVESSRLKSIVCTSKLRFACRESNGTNWMVTKNAGAWKQGAEMCRSESSGKFLFAAPYNEMDAMNLNAQKVKSTAPNVWINYFDSGNHNWQVSR